jgi:hypothetical protein
MGSSLFSTTAAADAEVRENEAMIIDIMGSNDDGDFHCRRRCIIGT